jgi:hypothetical protein
MNKEIYNFTSYTIFITIYAFNNAYIVEFIYIRIILRYNRQLISLLLFLYEHVIGSILKTFKR